MEAARGSVVVRGVRAAGVGDGGNDLPRDADATDGLVRCGVADDQPEARDLGAGAEANAGDRLEQTAWAMLHRYRTAMVRPGRDRLSGIVEADETFLGGPEPGVRGRGAQGKVMVEVAVEQVGRGLGRCRLQVIPDVAGPTLRAFMLNHVEPGSVVITDGLASYGRPAARSTSTGPSRSGRPANKRTSYSPPCTASRRSCSAGCSAPTKAASSPGTCRHTWTSSPSDSTADAHGREECSSTGCSSRPSKPSRGPTARSSPTPAPDTETGARHRPTNASPTSLDGDPVDRPWRKATR